VVLERIWRPKDMKKMNVIITGASSGIGKATAEYFLDSGHTVYSIDIKKSDNEKITSYVADIRDSEALEAIYNDIKAKEISFDAIISVAGVHEMASLVETDFNKVKRLMDINLLGTMLVNKTLYPLLNKDGRIIIVTSEVASYDPMPFNGLYNISKTALECYAQALRQELNLIGQRVITVLPGSTLTPLEDGSQDATKILADTTVYYKKQAKHFEDLVRNFRGRPTEPKNIARLIYKAVVSKHPRLSYAKHRNIGLVLLSILPKRLQCFIVKLLLNRK
jgi:NAD(P)-dependent dehydrogenase (short-subunit alcohol dehydrogenase family)